MNGKVKFYNDDKEFGFITAEDGKDYFVHKTGINNNVILRENDSVTFDTEEGLPGKGPKAVNVEVVAETQEEAA